MPSDTPTIPLRPAPPDALDAPRDHPAAATDTPPSPALLVGAAEAARLYAVSAATWWRWAAAGRVPAALRIGSCVRWRRAELEAHIAARAPDRRTWEALRAAQRGGRG